MNILVTGGCGFIGHNVVQTLEQLTHTVAVIDNKISSKDISDLQKLQSDEKCCKLIQLLQKY